MGYSSEEKPRWVLNKNGNAGVKKRNGAMVGGQRTKGQCEVMRERNVMGAEVGRRVVWRYDRQGFIAAD